MRYCSITIFISKLPPLPLWPYYVRELLALLFLILALSGNSQAPYIQYISQNQQFLVKNLQAPSQPSKSSKPAEWGTYFWEFGDGHYSFDETPVHQFQKRGLYEVKVYLTPHYSYTKPISFSKKISVSGGAGPEPAYSLDGKWAQVESNAGQYLIPGHEIQVVLHYQAPPGQDIQEGYVLLFYNNKKENKDFGIKFDPLRFQEERLYYGEKALGADFFSLPQSGLPQDGLTRAKALFNLNSGLRIFKTPALKAGQARRLFCTIAADQRLENFQDKNRELSFTVLWLPAGNQFDSKKNEHALKMEILEVHDPNRIKVQKNYAYYLPKRPTQLNYKVDFQNKAKGVVKDVIIRIPLPGELNTNTLEALENRLDPQVPRCIPGEESSAKTCYELKTDTLQGRDSMIFTFRNIALEGAKSKGVFENKKSTKGSIAFSIQNKRKRVPETPLRAYIIFSGSQEVIQTQFTTTHWRQRSINLSIGQNYAPRAQNFSNTADSFRGRYNISISALDAPLGRGLLLGAQLGATAFEFMRVSDTAINPGLLLPTGGIWRRSEQISLQYLEGKALAGYQLNRFLRLQAGAGLSLPLKAQLDVEAYAASDAEAAPVVYSQSSTEFGLLGDKAPARIFEQEIDARHSMGFTGALGLEAGLPNDLAVGLSYEVRSFPRSYHDACSVIRSWQLYLRGKFFAFR